jgi:hypothetical protein
MFFPYEEVPVIAGGKIIANLELLGKIIVIIHTRFLGYVLHRNIRIFQKFRRQA